MRIKRSLTITLRHLMVFGALLPVGCAQFDHQTTESEPHGLIAIPARDIGPGLPYVKKIDGLAVTPGREYRVKLGVHQFVASWASSEVNHYGGLKFGNESIPEPRPELNVSASGKTELTGAGPGPTSIQGPQMLKLNVESRRDNSLGDSVVVEAGWRYELNGYTVSRAPLPQGK